MENKYITFEDYLRNQLKENEANDFLKSLDDNPDLRKEFEDYKFLRENLVRKFNVKTDKQLLAHLERYGDKYFKGKDSKVIKISKVKNLNRWLTTLAASVALIFGSLFISNQVLQAEWNGTQLAINGDYSEIRTERSEGGETSPHFDELIKLYDEKKYTQLVSSFNVNQMLENERILGELLVAKSFMQSGEAEKALEDLKILYSQSDHNYHHEIEYHMARCLIIIGEKEEGLQRLEKMANSDHTMKRSARELLKKFSSWKHWIASF